MKSTTELFFALLVALVSINHLTEGFAMVPMIRANTFAPRSSVIGSTKQTKKFMFSGSGAVSTDEDPEKEKQIESAAKAMGMTAADYKLIMKAQEDMMNALNSLRVSGASASGEVMVELDGNAPPKSVKISITENGKALGKAKLEKEVLAALKEANAAARDGQMGVLKRMNDAVTQGAMGK